MSIFNPTTWLASKKLSLDKVKLDDLKREKFKLENEIKLLKKEEEQANSKRESLEDDYRDAHPMGKEAVLDSIARDLETLEMESQGVVSRIEMAYSVYQTTIGLIVIKKNQAFFERCGVGSLVGKMNIDELRDLMQKATVEGKLQRDKLAQLLGATNILTETDNTRKENLRAKYDALLDKPMHRPVRTSADEELAALNRVEKAAERVTRAMKENS